jgi:phosphoenolpyruvate carboxylase
MVPAWLGAGAALKQFIAAGNETVIDEMFNDWPFFNTRLSMLEMVYAKADTELALYYDELLVDTELRYLGDKLRAQLENDKATILHIGGEHELMADQPWNRESIRLRNIYTDPLNLLQANLLKRNRENPDETTKLALMTTIAGIAAGMRNTG